MTKEEIDSIHIEHRSEDRYWNITMFVVPKKGSRLCYADLVATAEYTLRESKGLSGEWFPSNAEVMAWSSKKDRGILTPDRFRVTLDMVTKDIEELRDEDR